MNMRSEHPRLPFAVIATCSDNLGDDVQTLAAIQFLKKKGVQPAFVIDRERLSSYSGPACKLLMNGWFMHDLAFFPPPPQVTPIFISFHCANEALIASHVAYFQAHQPIGCRDLHTQALFKKHGVQAYFPGCLTLTFDPGPVERVGRYTVDVNTCPYIPPVAVDLSVLGEHVLIRHDVQDAALKTNMAQRLAVARALLAKYQQAELVVTSRLHVALPCRAFRTPCIFLHSNLQDTRFSGLEAILSGSEKLENAVSRIPDEALATVLRGFDDLAL
jgi:hypothetical protein